MSINVGFIEGKGRGIFTDKRIHKGETIESAPVIEFPKEEWAHIGETVFGVYCFFWGEDFKDGAMVLGHGSLYNHSFNSNATYCRRPSDKMMDFIAIRDIEAGEEITINYNGDPEDNSPVWFDVVD